MRNAEAPARLETPRLLLRPFVESDWDALHTMFSDAQSVRYTLGTPFVRWQTWRMLATYLGHWQLRGYGPYATVDKQTDALVGVVGPWFPDEWPEPEINWSLLRAYTGRGFATEAATAVRDMAASHMGWQRAVSYIHPDNEASLALARRMGATFETTTRLREHTVNVFVHKL